MSDEGNVWNNFSTLAIGVCVLALCLVISFVIMGTTQDQSLSMGTNSTYETWASADNASAYTLTTDYAIGSTLTVYNVSTLVASGNYSASSDSRGFLYEIILLDPQYVGADLTMNFSRAGEHYIATDTLKEATASIPNWTNIVIICIIGSVLVGLVAHFVGRRE